MSLIVGNEKGKITKNKEAEHWVWCQPLKMDAIPNPDQNFDAFKIQTYLTPSALSHDFYHFKTEQEIQ